MSEKNQIWSFVGAGGKTTGIFLTADRLYEYKKKVLVTTSTHMMIPKREDFLADASPEEIKKRLQKTGRVTAGIPVSDEKMRGIDEVCLKNVRDEADVILIEADGSARMPFKVPAEHEPVILQETTRIFVVEGLSSLGRPIREVCHRAKLFCEMTGKNETDLLDEESMAAGITQGYLKRFWAEKCGMQITVILNQADTKEKMEAGREIRERIRESWGKAQKSTPECFVLSFQKIRTTGEELPWCLI